MVVNKFLAFRKNNNDQSIQIILEKNTDIKEDFTKIMEVISKTKPLENQIKKKFLALALKIEDNQNIIFSNLDERTMSFMKKDHKILLFLALLKNNKQVFLDELVNYFCLTY